jgi:hypothetical protein
MARFRFSHLLLRERYVLESQLPVKEVLTRIYTKIGKPRPYALARELQARGPKTFDGLVDGSRDGQRSLVPEQYRNVKISGEVKPDGEKSKLIIHMGGDWFSTVVLVVGAAAVLGAAYAIFFLNDGTKPTNPRTIIGVSVAIGGYILGFFHFRNKVKWAKSFLARLLEGTEQA